jgi:hypothetical protein
MSIYWDSSSKGQDKNLRKTQYHNCWRVEVTINKTRIRKRFKNYSEAVTFNELLQIEKNKKECQHQ